MVGDTYSLHDSYYATVRPSVFIQVCLWLYMSLVKQGSLAINATPANLNNKRLKHKLSEIMAAIKLYCSRGYNHDLIKDVNIAVVKSYVLLV